MQLSFPPFIYCTMYFFLFCLLHHGANTQTAAVFLIEKILLWSLQRCPSLLITIRFIIQSEWITVSFKMNSELLLMEHDITHKDEQGTGHTCCDEDWWVGAGTENNGKWISGCAWAPVLHVRAYFLSWLCCFVAECVNLWRRVLSCFSRGQHYKMNWRKCHRG